MDSFKTLQDSISQALVATTRSATRLSAADIPFQRSLNPEVGTQLDEQNARLLQLAQRLLANAAASSDAVGPKLPDVDAIDNNWKGIIDVVDSLLEKADTSLDEYTGVVKRLAPSGEAAAAVTSTPGQKRFMNLPHNFPKPQLAFENVPTNDETSGFRPLMRSKPHAIVPLEESLKTYTDQDGREQYPHPYQTEIEAYKYPTSMYIKSEPQQYLPFETTTATLVDTPEALQAMLAELKTAKEIAIDLEHHDNRSYVGLVSLMQISTRNKDWIVDTLKPWRRQLECLNEVFADPSIIKVLHGSYMDIIWLQRDLGLYIVGLFDTYHAARALGYPGASLSYLLERFVNFKAQKQYQMADWRIRPLSPEMFDYARADTHFLLYVFDNMRNELIERSDFSNPEKDKVSDVLEKSRETALQRYEHPVYDMEYGSGSGGWYKLITRTPVQFTAQQFAVFRAVHKWRDDVAREEDESPLYIMSPHMVFSIARTIPTDKTALYSVMQNVSPIVRRRTDSLLNTIAKAKEVDENAPELNDLLKKISAIRFAEREAVASSETPAESTTPAPPVLQSSILAGPLATPPLRAGASSFWGPLWTGANAEQKRSVATLNVDLALPLPPLTAEVFAEVPSYAAPKEEQPITFVPKEDRPEEDKRTDIFIVKQLGGKRKRNTTESPAVQSEDAEMAGQADEVMLEEGPAAEKARLKAEKKAERRAKKEAKRLAEAQEGGVEEAQEEDEEAFDYATAPSVLRAREAEDKRSGKKKRDKKKNQGFNPYAKMADVPKGLARTQVEKAGRSKTFKS